MPTVGLEELGVNEGEFAQMLLERYSAEIDDIWLARCKVRAVSEE